MDLSKNREEIDLIDSQIAALLDKRFDICIQIGQYKKENNIPVLDANRENEKIEMIRSMENLKNKEAICETYRRVMEISRGLQ